MFGCSSTYRVVFWGAIKVDEDKTDVALKFAKKFGIRDGKVLSRLFSGRVTTLKKGLNHMQATQFSDVVRDLGAICRIEREVSLISDFVSSGAPREPGRHNPFVDLGEFGDTAPEARAAAESRTIPVLGDIVGSPAEKNANRRPNPFAAKDLWSQDYSQDALRNADGVNY